MSKNKKKNAQPVEASKQSQDSSEAVLEQQPQEATAAPMPFDLSKVDPKKVKLAEEMGVPVGQIITWAMGQEIRVKALEEQIGIIEREMPQKVVAALQVAAREAQKKRMEQMQQGQGQQGTPQRGSGLATALGMAKDMGVFGGGGMDEEMVKMQREMFRLNIDRIKSDIGFTDAFKKLMLSKMASKTVSELTE